MDTITLHRWFIRDELTGKRRATCYRMSEADARSVDPTAQPVPGTQEVRERPACTVTFGAAHLSGPRPPSGGTAWGD